jgi:predicted dehydrogenase
MALTHRLTVSRRHPADDHVSAFATLGFWQRAAGSFRDYPNAKPFKDYRIMLPELESSIDAVIVATPDHHHFHSSMAAIRLAKHVYCEEPLTHSIMGSSPIDGGCS